MFDTLADAWYVWIGLTAVAAVAFGVGAGLPTEPPPDAAAAVATIDGVVGHSPPARGTHDTVATAVRADADHLRLRNGVATTTARLAFGPVLAVGDGPLRRVALGDPLRAVFDTRARFRDAVRTARETGSRWRRGSQLVVRHVVWGGDGVALLAVR